MSDTYYTVAEAMRILGISVSRFYSPVTRATPQRTGWKAWSYSHLGDGHISVMKRGQTDWTVEEKNCAAGYNV